MVKKLIHIFDYLAKNFLYLLFPQQCTGCGAKHTYLCRECLSKISYPDYSKQDNIFAAGSYKDEWLKKAIWILKYRKGSSAAEPLAELVFQRIFLEGRIKNPDEFLYVPVPLSKERMKKRGFNQSEIIVRHLVEKLCLEKEALAADALVKIKETKAQASIRDYQQRLKNLEGAFAVKNPEAIQGKKIILIDDVSTTGTTTRECAKTLKKAGAKKVIAVVAAK